MPRLQQGLQQAETREAHAVGDDGILIEVRLHWGRLDRGDGVGVRVVIERLHTEIFARESYSRFYLCAFMDARDYHFFFEIFSIFGCTDSHVFFLEGSFYIFGCVLPKMEYFFYPATKIERLAKPVRIYFVYTVGLHENLQERCHAPASQASTARSTWRD
jgi:hypothetical protein